MAIAASQLLACTVVEKFEFDHLLLMKLLGFAHHWSTGFLVPGGLFIAYAALSCLANRLAWQMRISFLVVRLMGDDLARCFFIG